MSTAMFSMIVSIPISPSQQAGPLSSALRRSGQLLLEVEERRAPLLADALLPRTERKKYKGEKLHTTLRLYHKVLEDKS